jgi:hypothetical protein
MSEQGQGPSRGSPPSIEEARAWVGNQIDEIGGSGVARVQSVYVDSQGGAPAWLIAKLGRFGKLIAIPSLDCAEAAGRVWVPYTRDALQGAPLVDPSRPLTREQELALCAHYGIDQELGRGKQVSGRPPNAITAQAAGESETFVALGSRNLGP